MCKPRNEELKRYHDMPSIEEFFGDESGLVTVEYVIGAAGLVIAVGLIFANYGSGLLSKLTAILDLL